MPVLRTAVREIAYADHGDEAAPAVVVVHGWPDAARGWTPVVDALVAAGLRVLVPDLRGAGDTRFTHSETVRDGTAVALAQDVVDVVLMVLATLSFAAAALAAWARAALTVGLVISALCCAVLAVWTPTTGKCRSQMQMREPR